MSAGKITVCRYLTAQLHPGLYRVNYVEVLAERFDANPAEIRRFLNGRLNPERTAELGAALRDAAFRPERPYSQLM